jgi:cardiolipin synthase
VSKANAFPVRSGNRLALLQQGAEFFPMALRAIEQAVREVRLETYILANDAVGQALCSALIQAVARGVQVKFVLDGFGAKEGIQQLVPKLQLGGVQVRVFRPEGALFKFSRNRLRRLHRKMLAVDEALAFVGGINWIDDLNHEQEALAEGAQRLGARYDFAVRLEGPIVQDVWHSMGSLWAQVNPDGRVLDSFRIGHWLAARRLLREQAQQSLDGVPVQLLVRDNVRFRRRIENAYLYAISKAKHSVLISNAYFLPSRRIRKAIQAACRRGVQVRLLLQGRVEYRLQHYATQYLYEEMWKSGVEIYEYTAGFLHAKVAVVDSHWATVGSSNLDPLSILLAREANVAVFDAVFAKALEQALCLAMEQDAHQVTPDVHLRHGWGWWCMRWLSDRLIRLAVLLGGEGGRY